MDNTPVPDQPSFFFDSEGLRPVWGLVAFSFIPACLILLGRLVAHYFPLLVPSGPVELTPLITCISEAVEFAFLAAQAFILSLVERRSFGTYGLSLGLSRKRLSLPGNLRALPDFAAGLLFGFLFLSFLIAALYLTHSITFQGLTLHGLPAATYALKWLIAFFFVGLFEEFFFRGYLQTTLTRALLPVFGGRSAPAFWAAAAILSVGLFAWTHTGNGGENPAGIAAVALAGVTFAFSLYRTGTLWWAIGFHTSWDWAQSFFYGTPDSGNLARGHLLNTLPAGNPLLSGGSAGPEGSLLVIPTLLLTCLVIHLTLPKRNPSGRHDLHSTLSHVLPT